jgi:ABC-type phosphate/phosphonate transport system substrate-binding protein
MKLLRVLTLPLIWLSLAAAGALLAGDTPVAPALKKARLHVIASELLFSTVNSGDALASMRIWAEQIGKTRGFQFDTKMEIGRSVGQMRDSLKEHSVDLLVLDTTEYLALADAGLVEALAAGTIRGQLLAFPYLLLTKDASEGGIEGLRGKRIVVVSRLKSNLALVWLETLLADSKLGRAAAFFGSVENGYRASACVLPLFFGKIDACVVDAGNWDSIKELNPQLGRLRVVARSEAVLEGLIAKPVEPHPYQNELIDSVMNLHKTPAGEQLSLVFKTGVLVRVGKEPFESVRALCGKYRRIVNPSGDGSSCPAGRLGETAAKERK